MPFVEIRRATAEEAFEIARAHVESWGTAYKGIVSDELIAARDLDDRLATWSAQLERDEPNARVYVVDFDGEVGGFAFSQPCSDEDLAAEQVAELTALYLRPAYLGRGAGTALADAALRDLREAGFNEVILWVLEENVGARRFYDRTGWKWDGTRAPCYRVFAAPALRYRRAP